MMKRTAQIISHPVTTEDYQVRKDIFTDCMLLYSCVKCCFNLKVIVRDGSEEGWEPFPITQTGTRGKITHLCIETNTIYIKSFI